MKKITLLFSLIAVVFLFVNCNKSVIYDENVTFPDNNWSFENKAITFEASLISSEKPYSIILELEIIGTLNVNSFYATFSTTTPKGGNTIKSIFFNFDNPKEPYVKGNSPNVKIYRLTVYPKRFFSETGIYTFEIDQFSNKADNRGIRSLRMLIENEK